MLQKAYTKNTENTENTENTKDARVAPLNVAGARQDLPRRGYGAIPSPGPWQILQEHVYDADAAPAPFTGPDGVHYPDHCSGLVALVYAGEANRRLIAAAPDLLAALKELERAVVVHGCAEEHDERLLTKLQDVLSACRAAKDAIAKAEGRAS